MPHSLCMLAGFFFSHVTGGRDPSFHQAQRIRQLVHILRRGATTAALSASQGCSSLDHCSLLLAIPYIRTQTSSLTKESCYCPTSSSRRSSFSPAAWPVWLPARRTSSSCTTSTATSYTLGAANSVIPAVCSEVDLPYDLKSFTKRVAKINDYNRKDANGNYMIPHQQYHLLEL